MAVIERGVLGGWVGVLSLGPCALPWGDRATADFVAEGWVWGQEWPRWFQLGSELCSDLGSCLLQRAGTGRCWVFDRGSLCREILFLAQTALQTELLPG